MECVGTNHILWYMDSCLGLLLYLMKCPTQEKGEQTRKRDVPLGTSLRKVTPVSALRRHLLACVITNRTLIEEKSLRIDFPVCDLCFL